MSAKESFTNVQKASLSYFFLSFRFLGNQITQQSKLQFTIISFPPLNTNKELSVEFFHTKSLNLAFAERHLNEYNP